MAGSLIGSRTLDLPALDRLDEHQIETFYDADLDELTVHFYGRNMQHYVDPVNDVLSTLKDPVTDKVVGVVFSQFLKVVIQDLPESRIFFDDATILTGDHILRLSSDVPVRRSLATRLMSTLRAMRRAWHEVPEATKKEQRRRVFEAIPSLCS